MPDLRVGAKVDSDDWPASRWAQDTTQITNISNTTPTAGSPTVQFTFVAPTSGRVIIVIGGGFRSGDANRIFLMPYVWLGSGTGGSSVLTSSNFSKHGVGGVNQITKYAHFSRRSLLEGLNAGSTYFAQARYYVDGGSTADLRNRDLAVVPVA